MASASPAGQPGAAPDRTASAPLPVSIGVLSFAAHDTLANSLATHRAGGLDSVGDDFFVYFNARTPADDELAARFGVTAHGSAANSGIYGGFRAIAEQARHPYVLILENDIVTVAGPDAVAACLASCLADMREHGIKAFSLRSRRQPGQGIEVGIDKYRACFPVREPLRPDLGGPPPSLLTRARMRAKYLDLDPFVATALFIEERPELAHPAAIRRLPSGNYATTSRYRKWSNQSVLVERRFFLDVICRRVDEHPDPRLVNGHQDIERAVVGGVLATRWWQGLAVPMGQARDGCFSHHRLDRKGT